MPKPSVESILPINLRVRGRRSAGLGDPNPIVIPSPHKEVFANALSCDWRGHRWRVSHAPQQAAQILDAVVVPSLEMLAKWEREGRINGGSFAGRRGGCMIIDAPSHEELADLLMTLPFWGLQDWTITPLSSNEAAVKRVRELSQRLKSAGQR